MAHHTLKSSYDQLSERLNRFPQGAPPSQLLFQILSMLVSENEAGLIAQLPIKPFTVGTAAKAWKISLFEAQKMLDALADRAMLLDTPHPNGETQLGRAFVQERALPPEKLLEVLDYEKASQVIRTASHIGG